MSAFYPHTDYAEDQPYYHTILTTHVLHRGFTAGALVGTGGGAIRSAIAKYRGQPALLFPTILRRAGSGTLWSTGLLAIALVGRMRGREEIEWKDRSWRLLENKGQVEVDNWSLSGIVGGALGGALMRPSGWRVILGGAGLGSLAGTAGYMIYRYGVKGGKWEDEV